MTFRSPIFGALALAGLAACAGPVAQIGAIGEPEVTRTTRSAPPGAEPGTCWGTHVSPAVIETVTEHLLIQPAEVLTGGTVTRPAIYKTETTQKIVQERRETWFQTPCDDVQTAEFVASVQRALAARGLYRGPVNGEMDRATRSAVRRFQAPQGLDSGILSLAAARELGLIAVEIDG